MIKHLAIALALTAPLATAEIYQWTDKEGKPHFSNYVPANAKDAKKLDIQTEPPASSTSKENSTQAQEAQQNHDSAKRADKPELNAT